MANAYIFGCSHAAGSEMADHDISKEYLMSYPALLAADLGYEIRNHAIPGGSNDAIFRALFDNLKNINPSDMIIFCWTVPGRSEIWSEDNKQYLTFAPGCLIFNRMEPHPVALQGRFVGEIINDHQGWMAYHRQWQMRFLDSQARNEQLQDVRNIIAANELAKKTCDRVLNIRSAGHIDEVYQNNVGHYCWPIGLENDFWKFCRENNLPSTKQGHFSPDAHRLFADHIKACI